MLMALIALIGWTAITALTIAADLYLRQFRLDVEDNLLPRKHVTQRCASYCTPVKCWWRW